MSKKQETNDQVSLAPVDPTGPASAVRSDADTASAEARIQDDQDPDYHKRHPTLKTDGPEHDPKVQQRLREAAAKAAR